MLFPRSQLAFLKDVTSIDGRKCQGQTHVISLDRICAGCEKWCAEGGLHWPCRCALYVCVCVPAGFEGPRAATCSWTYPPIQARFIAELVFASGPQSAVQCFFGLVFHRIIHGGLR